MTILRNAWDQSHWRIAFCFPVSEGPLRPYGISGVIGALAGLVDSDVADSISIAIVDTSGNDPERARKKIEKLRHAPHICMGVIRSNVAAALLPYCEGHDIALIGTDHAAARFVGHETYPKRYFRVSRVADQMVRACLHAFSYAHQEARRLLVVVSDYEYGRSIQEATLKLVSKGLPWLSAGVVGVMEWPTSKTENRQREYANKLAESLNAIKPDAVLLGLWGKSMALFREMATKNPEAVNIPLLIPDAGWDKPSHGHAFPQFSVLGARYYVPTDAYSDSLIQEIIALVESIECPFAIDVTDVRYPIAAAYHGALAIRENIKRIGGRDVARRPHGYASDQFVNSFKNTRVPTRWDSQTGPFGAPFELRKEGEYRLVQDHCVAVAKKRTFMDGAGDWDWYRESELTALFPEARRRSSGGSSGSVAVPLPT